MSKSTAYVVVAAAVLTSAIAEAHVQPNLIGALSAVAQERLQTVVATAEMMPAADYDFRPVPGTRSFGELVAHVADTNHAFCSAVGGARQPIGTRIERTVHDKPTLISELKASLDVCARALAKLDDARLPSPVAFGGGALIDGTQIPVQNLPAGMIVALLASHTDREYGKLTIYLRHKGLVPPTSRPARDR